MPALVPPDLAPTWTWLRERAHPAAALILHREGILYDGMTGPETARRAVLADPAVDEAIGRQLADGSWGPQDSAPARILPTLWGLKALVDLGFDHDLDAVYHALEFLSTHATTPEGYFSTTGQKYGVLACYVGLTMRLFHDAGRADMAAAQLEWLTWYQQVSVAGEHRREARVWGQGLETRYGGCFSATSCVTGLVRAAEAFSRGADREHEEAFGVVREALLERELIFTRDGAQILPLSAPGRTAHRWTAPAFPRDWRIDLADVLHAVASDDPLTDARAQRAIDVVMSWRRPDGSWSRGWHTTPAFMAGIGAVQKGEGNPVVTAHVAVALSRLTG